MYNTEGIPRVPVIATGEFCVCAQLSCALLCASSRVVRVQKAKAKVCSYLKQGL